MPSKQARKANTTQNPMFGGAVEEEDELNSPLAASVQDDDGAEEPDVGLEEQEDAEFRLTGDTRFLGPPDSPLRVAAFNLLFSPLMDMAVLVLVGLTFAGQAMRMPASVDSLLRPQEGSLSELAEDEGSNYIAQVGSYIGVLGEVVMVIFTIECIAKILVLGFYRGADSYLKSGWNQLDFVVLLLSWFDVIAGTGMYFIRVIRGFRILRPFRKVRLVEGLVSAVEFYPYVLNVCMFLAFFMCIFGTIGVQLFGGTLSYRCADNSSQALYWHGEQVNYGEELKSLVVLNGSLSELAEDGAVTLERCPRALRAGCTNGLGDLLDPPEKGACIHVAVRGPGKLKQGPVAYPYQDDRIHETSIYGFDNIVSAFLTQFVATTMDEWPALSHPMKVAGGTNDGLVYTFFVTVILLLGMVIANLFVSVICFGFGNVDRSDEIEEGRAYVRKVRALFDRFDTDGGGTIDAAEVENMGKLLGSELTAAELRRAVFEMDEDGGGEVDFEEFVHWWSSHSPIAVKLRRAVIAEEALISASFERIDTDKSGTLDTNEIGALADVMGLHLTEAEVAEAVAQLRVQQGEVSFDAFAEWWLAGSDLAKRLVLAAKGEDDKLRMLFNKIDADRSGEIDESDFEQELSALVSPGGSSAGSDTARSTGLLGPVGPKKAAAMLAEMRQCASPPIDAGAGVDFATFVLWWKSGQPQALEIKKAQQQDEAKLRRIWQRMLEIANQSDSGRIGADELAAICSKIGLEQRPDQISATLAAIDYHGDGKVEWEEFYIWVSEESESAIELRDSMKTMMAQEQKPWPYIPGKSEALQELVESGPFDVAVMGVVIANTAFMCLEYHNAPDWLSQAVKVSEMLFTVVYTIEAAMKIVGLGLAPYLSVRMNLMDLTIVCTSIVGIFVTALSGVAAFRVVRLVIKMLRMVRLASVFGHNDAMVLLLRTVIGSTDLLGSLIAFIFICMCLMSIAAGHLLGICHSPEKDEPWNGQEFGTDGFPRENFYYFSDAVLSNFQIMSGEDWAPMMYRYMSCAGYYRAGVYFVCVVVVTNFFLLNIFVAVVLENFELSEEEKLIKQESRFVESQGTKTLSRQFGEDLSSSVDGAPSSRKIAKVVEKGLAVDATGADEDEAQAEVETEEGGAEIVKASLFCCSVDSGLRQTCIKIAQSPHFEKCIVAAIIVSAVVIAVQGPPNAPYLGCSVNEYYEVSCEDAYIVGALETANSLVYIVFVLEMFIRIIAHGFSGGPEAYWNNGWNRLDFAIVIAGTLEIVLTFMDISGHTLRAFRVMRVLRPLRMLQFNEGIRIVFTALIDCLPTAVAVGMLSLLFYIAFGILGVSMFSGRFYRCDCGGDWGMDARNCTNPDFSTLNKKACEDQGGLWANPPYNFDSVPAAMRTLFICSTTEGWVDIMHAGMDASDISDPDDPAFYLAPQVVVPANRSALYFVAFILIGTFFITNLFIGVLVNFFGRANGSLLLTESQQQWMQTQELCRSVRPKVAVPPTEGIRGMLYPIATSHTFHRIMNVLILVNVFILMSESVPQTADREDQIQIANVALLCCFTAEMLIKLVAEGPTEYFVDYWNRLDSATVLMSWIGELASGIGGLQALRAIRVLRLAEGAETLQSLLATLLKSMIPASNIFALLCLVYFCFGTVGMFLFGETALTSPVRSHDSHTTCGLKGQFVTDEDNFDDILHAMKLMFQISTGQDFLNLMYELENRECPFVFPFFMTYIVTSIWVFFNFFVAVVLENFDRNFVASQMQLSIWHVAQFKRTWQMLTAAPLHTGLPAQDLVQLVPRLPAPLSNIVDEGPLWLNRVLFELKIDLVAEPTATVEFHEALLALCLVSHSYEGLTYEQQQAKRALIKDKVMQYAGRVVVLCTTIYVLMKKPPPALFEKRLRAAGAVTDAELQRKWRSALRGVRLLMLDSVVRANKLGKSAAAPHVPLKSAAMSTLNDAQKLAERRAKTKPKPRSNPKLGDVKGRQTVSNPMFTSQDKVDELKDMLDDFEGEDRQRLQNRIDKLVLELGRQEDSDGED